MLKGSKSVKMVRLLSEKGFYYKTNEIIRFPFEVEPFSEGHLWVGK